MIKALGVVGLFVAGSGMLAVSGSSAAPEAAPSAEGLGSTTGDQEEVVLTARASARAPAKVEAHGLVCTAVPAALARHLELAAGEGLMVLEVQDCSPADEAGFEPYDVLLAFDGEDAEMEALAAALQSGDGLALKVVRDGELQDATLPAEPAGDEESRPVEAAAARPEFLSIESLEPDHPIRRLAQLRALEESYSKKSSEYAERRRELEQEARQARDQARGELEGLRETARAQVAGYLEERQVELLRIVDEHFSEDRTATLAGLRIDLEAVLPAERVEGLAEHIAELEKQFPGALVEALTLEGDERTAKERKKVRERFARLGREVAELVDDRLDDPWRSARKEVREHTERLGAKHDGRVQWTARTLEAIRGHMHERITCAVQRTNEDFAKRLDRRLNRMELPGEGEIEASLADLSGQLEAWTMRFVRRTDMALALYEEALTPARAELTPALQGDLTASERALTQLRLALDADLQAGLASPIHIDGSWHGQDATNRAFDGLHARLRATVNAGRDALREGSVELLLDLREERHVSDDAWEDLKHLLQGVQSDSDNDCWKLDGPHLDGRFPKKPAKKKSGGEVVMAGS